MPGNIFLNLSYENILHHFSPDGPDLKRITNMPDVSETYAVLSPDESKYAYVAEDTKGHEQIFVMNFDGTGSRKNANLTIFKASHPQELLNKYEINELNALAQWMEAMPFKSKEVYYLLNNNSENVGEFKFSSENLNEATLHTVPTIMITSSKRQFIGTIVNIYK